MAVGLTNVTWLAAFVAGLASFLTPCVLPLIPVYLSYLAGVSVSQLSTGGTKRKPTLLLNGLLFVAGFSAVFIVLGAGASELGRYLLIHLKAAEQLAGILIVIFSLFMLGLIRIPFLQRTFKLKAGPSGIGPLASFALGLGFAFGWTPCVGPILGSILAMAAIEQNLRYGVMLLAFYSLGLALPFLLVLLGAQWALPKVRGLNQFTPWIEKGSGVLLLLLGMLMVTGSFSRFSALLGQ